MSKKLNVAILCGGKSPEHEISLCSAWNLVKAIDRERFTPVLIGVSREGGWYLLDIDAFLLQEPFAGTIKLNQTDQAICLVPGAEKPNLYLKAGMRPIESIDVVFPMLHGPNGEDGSMQGLIQQLQLPYVGPNVLSSSICMDKDIAKRLMQHAGIPTSNFIALRKGETISYQAAIDKLGSPLFVKPANMGSSLGVSKVRSETEFAVAVELAFQHDYKVVIEEFIEGREIECAILGNEDPVSSPPGQYLHEDDFFAYDTKYLKGAAVVMEIPAHGLDDQKVEEAKSLALATYRCLECEGLSRVDIFLSDDGSLRVNEVNTIPGFTNSSMYPGLMGSTGIDYTDLITRLIELAVERHDHHPAG